jgi:KaiC/GvpD/RAD55 family RecA-like ATPase
VAIDAVGDLAAATTDQRRLHDYLYALLQHMAVNNVTSMLTVQADRGGAGEPALLSLTDNVVSLDLSSPGTARSIRVVKARATAHDEGTHPITIETRGLRIG